MRNHFRRQQLILWAAALCLVLFGALMASQIHASDSSVGEDGHPIFLPLVVGPDAPTAPNRPDSNPRAVQVVIDAGASVTATIPVTGGTMQLTVPDGPSVALTMPPHALLSKQVITMTALSTVSDMPLRAGLLAGVHLEPEGLQLLRPATLTIAAQRPVPDGLDLVGFGYHGDGQEFHLRPVAESNNAALLNLTHFSGYGLTAGTPGEISQQAAQHAPTAPADQLAQKMATPNVATAEELAWWWDNLVRETLDRASDSDAKLEKALVDFLEWLHFVQDAGLTGEEPFATHVEAGWGTLGFSLYYRTNVNYDACRQRDASRVIQMMRLVHLAESLPEQALLRADLLDEMREKARNCATFELDFDSKTVEDDWFPGPFASHVRAEAIRFQVNPDGASFSGGVGPLAYVSLTHDTSDGDGCTATSTKADGTFTVGEVAFNLNLNLADLSNPTPPAPNLVVNVYPGLLDDSVSEYCEGDWMGTVSNVWVGAFYALHLHDIGYPSLAPWRYIGGELYAESITEIQGQDPFDGMSATTWMVLVHTPQ